MAQDINTSFEQKLDICLTADRIPPMQVKEDAWIQLLQRIDTSETLAIRPVRWSSYLVRFAAAGVMLLAAISMAYLFSEIRIENTQSQAATHLLPDGSSVNLTSGSQISYNKFQWMFHRSVELDEGLVFFDVKEGSTFEVSTPKGQVRVLGTSFTVELQDAHFEVACKTGKVAVESAFDNFQTILVPGTKVRIQNTTIHESTLAPEHIGAWVNGAFYFDHSLASTAISKIAASAGYTANYQGDPDLYYTGYLQENLTIDQMMTIVCKPLNLSFEISPSTHQITITKNQNHAQGVE
jgi:ferric-dicitrate binding protein FerR (iron transport regulator)